MSRLLISTPNGARAPAHTCPHTWTLISAAQRGVSNPVGTTRKRRPGGRSSTSTDDGKKVRATRSRQIPHASDELVGVVAAVVERRSQCGHPSAPSTQVAHDRGCLHVCLLVQRQRGKIEVTLRACP